MTYEEWVVANYYDALWAEWRRTKQIPTFKGNNKDESRTDLHLPRAEG